MSEIRQLIDRVADALGPDASAERVERVVRAVMESGVAPSGGTKSESRLVVTAYGHDQPGILAALTAALSECEANIHDVSQKVLQGYFTVIMLADLSTANRPLAEIQKRLSAEGQRLGVKVHAQHEDLFLAMHRP